MGFRVYHRCRMLRNRFLSPIVPPLFEWGKKETLIKCYIPTTYISRGSLKLFYLILEDDIKLEVAEGTVAARLDIDF